MTKLYMVRRDGGKDEYLDTSKDDCDSWRVAGDADLTPVAIADLLDQDAENGNWHEPATLEWKWVSAGRWEADSINTPGYVYAILLDGQRFYFIRHAYGDASIDYTFASWLPTMREAQEWCERQDDSLMPF